MSAADYETYMRHALELARQAWVNTHLSPVAGAVIVEDDHFVAEGLRSTPEIPRRRNWHSVNWVARRTMERYWCGPWSPAPRRSDGCGFRLADERYRPMLRSEGPANANRLGDFRHEVVGEDTLTRGRVIYPERTFIDETTFGLW